jgi:hypothetical protein
MSAPSKIADLAAETAVGRRAAVARGTRVRLGTGRAGERWAVRNAVRNQDARPLFFWLGIFLLTVLLAGLASGSVALPSETVPTPTPTIRVTATASPTPVGARLLTESRGFVAVPSGGSAFLRREPDADATSALRGQGFIGASSGTGRRIAYWVTMNNATRELRVFDATAPDQDTTLATLLEAERGAAAVWSSDRSGLLVVVESSGQTTGAEAPGPFSALRVVDAPTRTIREIARVTDGSQFWPVGWDRDSRLAGACIYGGDGLAIAYAITSEDGLSSRVPMDAGIPAGTVRSSGTGVLGVVKGAVIRVWSIASYNEHRELGAPAGDTIAFARWRPGGTEIVVSISDRLEIWPPAGGDHHVVARGLPAASDLLMSADGALGIVTFDAGRSAVAIDLATGRTAALPMSNARLVAAVSYR